MAHKIVNKRIILVLLALAQFMVVMDISIVSIALPSIQKAFSLSPADLQWIITAYTLMFGGFLLLGGRSADLFGRRRTFLAGVSVFTLASLGTGLSGSGTMVIIFRALQGLAAASILPSALSMVLVTFKEGSERNGALSIWGTVASGGIAAGVVFGGLFTQLLGWRWNFFINVPVGVFLVAASLFVLDKHESTAEHRNLDLPGAVSVTGGLMLLVYGLTQAQSQGWANYHTFVFFVASAILLTFFLFNESRTKRPLIPLRLFKIRNLSGANSLIILMAGNMLSSFFFSTFYLQNVLRYSPIQTGVDFIAVPLGIIVTATNVPRIIKRVGYRPILIVAPLIVGAGLLFASFLPANGTYLGNVLPSFVLIGLGMGATIVSATIAATSGIAQHESGLAAGLYNTSTQIGGSLVLAILTTVATSSTLGYRSSTHGHTSAVALVHGYDVAFRIAAIFALVASLLAVMVIRTQAAKTDLSHELSEVTT